MGNSDRVLLDINATSLQDGLFRLTPKELSAVFKTLRKLRSMNWADVYRDNGLKWEAILSRTGTKGERLYSFRISRGFRAVAVREGAWLRLISLHPDHDSAYKSR